MTQLRPRSNQFVLSICSLINLFSCLFLYSYVLPSFFLVHKRCRREWRFESLFRTTYKEQKWVFYHK